MSENMSENYCCTPLCEWEAVTERGERRLCAQCAQAFDAGVEYAQRNTDGNVVEIEFYTTDLYGVRMDYVASPIIRRIIQHLLNKKTVARRDKETIAELFEALGFTVKWTKVPAPEDEE